MSKYWIVVASAEHAERGRAAGFMQACHGKRGPISRLSAGDRVVCYSPTETFGGKDRLQAFTSVGRIKDERAYQVDMGGGFHPFRRDVTYASAQATPIKPMLDELDLTKGRSNWGSRFRFGLIEITQHDFDRIAKAMGADAREQVAAG
jgi:hypothetical protein